MCQNWKRLFDWILAPKTVPTDVKVKANGTTSIIVTWEEILHDNFLQGYVVKYTKKGALSSKLTEVDKVEEMVLENLKKFTEYTIQVAARSSQPGNYSKAISATTFEDGKLSLLYIFKWETFY